MKKVSDAALKKAGRYLINHQQTIAVAESVTAGLLQYILSNIPDASQFYHGGITAYNLAQKFRHLHIEPIHGEAVNCVSEQVAAEMALGVSELFNSHWAAGITGYATPVPESGNTVYAFYAIAKNKKIVKAGKLRPPVGSPEEIQLYYANAVMEHLCRLLK